MTDVLTYLTEKNMPLKRAGGWEMNTPCVFCHEKPEARGRLYINVDPEADIQGLFLCHLCGAKGNITTLKRHFGDNVERIEIDSALQSEILDESVAFYESELTDFPEVLEYLQGPKRGLSVETIKKYRLGYAPMRFEQIVGEGSKVIRPNGLYRYLRDAGYEPKDIIATGLCQEADGRLVDSLGGMVSIPYLVSGHPVAIRGRTWPMTEEDFCHWQGETYKTPPGKYKTCAGTKARLFNTDAAWDTNTLVLCEGELDAIVLTEAGFPAVGVPGAGSWQDGWDDYLTHVRRALLVFDRDQAGEKAANKLVVRFGSKVRRIHLSAEGTKCDPTEWFQIHTSEEFQGLVNAACRTGLLVTVKEAVAEFESIQGTSGLKFNFELLDLMIDPGLQPAQLMILLAKTGTGKTLMLLNLMHRMRMAPGQGHLRFLFVSLEQTRGEWWDRARRIHRFYNLESSEAEAERWWQDNLMIVDKNRLTEHDLHQVVEEYAEGMGQMPDVICLDYLGYFARSFKGEGYERSSMAAMALKGIGKEYRVPIIAPHQVNRGAREGEEFGADAARESGVIEETADFLFTVWSPDNQLARTEAEKTGHLDLRIAKSRHGGRGTQLGMQFAPVSLVMVPDGDPLHIRARQEFRWRNMYKDSWSKAVYRHRTGFEGKLDVVPDLDGHIDGIKPFVGQTTRYGDHLRTRNGSDR